MLKNNKQTKKDRKRIKYYTEMYWKEIKLENRKRIRRNKERFKYNNW